MLEKVGLQEATEKSVKPTMRMLLLGILGDTIKITLELDEERLQNIRNGLKTWENRKTSSLKQIQQLLWVLNFAAYCAKPCRIFVARLINFLKTIPDEEKRRVPVDVKLDIKQWLHFMETYNGISVMPNPRWEKPDHTFSSNSCLLESGALTKDKYFHCFQ